MTTTTDQLAETVEALTALQDSLGADCPTRDAIVDEVRGKTYALPRGVTLTTRDDNGVVYVETRSARIWTEAKTSRDGRTDVTVTIYGTVNRGERESRGSVDVRHLFTGEYGDGTTTRAYWSTLTGAAVPDGARAAVAEAVRGAVAGMLTEHGWEALADEADAAAHAAGIRREIGTALRALDNARRMIGRGQS